MFVCVAVIQLLNTFDVNSIYVQLITRLTDLLETKTRKSRSDILNRTQMALRCCVEILD